MNPLPRILDSVLKIFNPVVFVKVLGEIDPSELGRTLTHEHLSMQFEVSYVPPPETFKGFGSLPWKLENIGWIRQFPFVFLSFLSICTFILMFPYVNFD